MPDATGTLSGNALAEAIEAARRGQRARARDLLTRVLRSDQTNEQAWLWMSAVVETEKEQIYCLESVLRINPGNLGARYGLVLLGSLPPEEWTASANAPGAEAALPAGEARRVRAGARPAPRRPRSRRRTIELGIIAAVGLVTVVVLGAALLAFFRLQAQARLAASFTATPTASQTPTVTPTPPPSATPLPSATPTTSGSTPLAQVLGVNFTPTPLYFVTPHPEEAYRLGVRAYQEGRWSDVVTFMHQALAANRNLYEAYFFLGETYRVMEQLHEARQQFASGLEANPDYAPFYLGRGRTRLAQNQVTSALADFDEATRLDPLWADPYLARADYFRGVGDLERAREELEAAAVAAPGNAVVRWQLASVLADLGQVDRASDEITQAFEIDPTIVEVYGVRGFVMLLRQQYPQALADLSTYLAYTPRDATAYYRRALARLGLGDPPAALVDLNAALALRPADTEALILRADLLLEAGQTDQAIADYTAAIDVSDSAEARVGRGRAYLALNDDDRALADLRRAADLAPQDYPANLWLGRATVRMQLFAQAIEPLGVALDSATGDAERFEALYWRAQAFEGAGDEAGAIDDWRLLLALPVDDARKEEAAARLQALDAYTPVPTFTPTPSTTSATAP